MKDFTSEIITVWYELLQDNHVGVQPKAATLLKQVLDRYDISVKSKDIWDEFMTVKAGEFDNWYNSLTPDQQAELNTRRQRARTNKDPREILKG